MLCKSLLFMCVKQKCNIYSQKYYILVIFVDFYASFPMILTDFIWYPDPDGIFKLPKLVK